MAGQGSGGNVLAALCNIFIPGLGQLLQGRILAAILFFVFWCISWALVWVLIGWVILPIVYIWCIIDAAKYRGPPL
ncbi:hypothetical protein [Neptunicella sp. SCSIO 80796]|uniref:hypothetical protein n=1 Tax=Neptunicella plasticusilytica TaxID=3117012 RepID=UPI003A4DC4E0